MSKSSLFAAATVLTLLWSGAASAYDFKLCNDTKRRQITEFRVEAARDREDYSPNWLKQPLRAGECFPMVFRSEDHPCHVRYMLRFRNGDAYKNTINICKARRLFVSGDGDVAWE